MLTLSQTGELEHRNATRRYRQTNKRQFVDQMVNLEVLEAVHERMYVELANTEGDTTAVTPSSTNQTQCDLLGVCDTTGAEESLADRYFIAWDQLNGVYLPAFLKDPKIATDPASKVCIKLPMWKDTPHRSLTIWSTGFLTQTTMPFACLPPPASQRQQ